MLYALRIVIKLKKVKADGLKVRQDNLALIVGPSSITPWIMFSRVKSQMVETPVFPDA